MPNLFTKKLTKREEVRRYETRIDYGSSTLGKFLILNIVPHSIGLVVCTTSDGLVCGGYNPKGEKKQDSQQVYIWAGAG
jgi:hypothetical protein